MGVLCPPPGGSAAVGCACPRRVLREWVTRGWGCHVYVWWVGFRERCVYHILVRGDSVISSRPSTPTTFLLEPPSLALSRQGRG